MIAAGDVRAGTEERRWLLSLRGCGCGGLAEALPGHVHWEGTFQVEDPKRSESSAPSRDSESDAWMYWFAPSPFRPGVSRAIAWLEFRCAAAHERMSCKPRDSENDSDSPTQ